MNSWRPYPLLRLVFPFLAGIVSECVFGSTAGAILWLPALMLFLVFLAQIIPVVTGSYRLRWVTGLLFNLFVFFAGYELACIRRPANDPGYLGICPDGLFIVSIAEPPTLSASGIKAILKVRYRKENSGWERSEGSAVGYLKSKHGARPPCFGDQILIRAGFTEISDNSNPHSFNYSGYLKNKGITHRVFADSYDWERISIQPTGYIRILALKVRDRLLDIFRANHVEGKEFAVAAALLLGYVDDLDPELRNDYAATGAMHILSVSGMHVGIIYIFLEFLLGFLNKHKFGRIFKAVLLLLFIWFYAMVTGLSPCVLRSAAMLSLPILGKSLNRSPDMFNIVAASIIFILIWDPFLILDVGFQLSYLAVAGILILYKPIYDLYLTSAWLPDKIWSILSVSIAAQIATLPITLYTFHQFPNYFMLTNIFVVPLSSLIIYVGILALVVGYVPVLSMVCTKVLIFLIWLLNSIIHFIEQLPYSTIRGIFISSPEMILLYVMIVALFLFLTIRRISFLYTFMIAGILINLLILNSQIHRLKSSRMVIFNANRDALYLFSAQDKAILLYNRTIQKEKISHRTEYEVVNAYMQAQGIHFHRDYWWQGRGRAAELAKAFVPLIVQGNFMLFEGCRIALVRSSIPKRFKKSLKVDLLILSQNPKISIGDALKIFHPMQIVIDATNSRYKTMQWQKDSRNYGIECHVVAEHGAFQKEL